MNTHPDWPHLSPARCAHLSRLHAATREYSSKAIFWTPRMEAKLQQGLREGWTHRRIAENVGVGLTYLRNRLAKMRKAAS